MNEQSNTKRVLYDNNPLQQTSVDELLHHLWGIHDFSLPGSLVVKAVEEVHFNNSVHFSIR